MQAPSFIMQYRLLVTQSILMISEVHHSTTSGPW